MKEIWKDIPGYEGLYQISSRKRIKNIKTGKCKISNTGKVSLSKKGKNKSTTIKYLYKISFRTFNNKDVFIRHFDLNNDGFLEKTEAHAAGTNWDAERQAFWQAFAKLVE